MVNGVDFIPERDMELYEAYRRALKMREVKSHREAVMRAISSHALGSGSPPFKRIGESC